MLIPNAPIIGFCTNADIPEIIIPEADINLGIQSYDDGEEGVGVDSTSANGFVIAMRVTP